MWAEKHVASGFEWWHVCIMKEASVFSDNSQRVPCPVYPTQKVLVLEPCNTCNLHAKHSVHPTVPRSIGCACNTIQEAVDVIILRLSVLLHRSCIPCLLPFSPWTLMLDWPLSRQPCLL
jgi:hypothetical protein